LAIGAEVVGRLDHDRIAPGRIDPEIAEQIRSEGLGTPADQHHRDAIHVDRGGVAERGSTTVERGLGRIVD
jgi:hypothetical protein